MQAVRIAQRPSQARPNSRRFGRVLWHLLPPLGWARAMNWRR
jgi:hypothetical protein